MFGPGPAQAINSEPQITIVMTLECIFKLQVEQLSDGYRRPQGRPITYEVLPKVVVVLTARSRRLAVLDVFDCCGIDERLTLVVGCA
jgi:hypothetical protein